jgi:hypothetical protein
MAVLLGEEEAAEALKKQKEEAQVSARTPRALSSEPALSSSPSSLRVALHYQVEQAEW